MTRVLSDDPLIRSMSFQSVLSAFGEGAFITGSAVFFTQVVGLSAAQVGVGMTIGMAVKFPLSVPLGRLADRVGTRTSWIVGALLQAVLFLSWLGIHSFAAYVAVAIAIELAEAFMRAGIGAYRIQVFPRDQRVRSMAYMRAARNVGYTLGAAAGGIALAFNDLDAIRVVPIFTGVLLLANTWWISTLPKLEKVSHHMPEGVAPRTAMRNRGFLAMTFLDGIISTHQVLLNVVIPLWLVEETNAPRVLLAWLFGTNTLLAVLLQVRAARGVIDIRSSLRAQHRAAACFVVSCGIIWVTDSTTQWLTIVLIWVGHLTITAAELLNSAGEWGLVSELSDSRRLGEYQGMQQLGYTLGNVWAPAAYTWLAIHGGMAGWLTIAAIVVAAAAAIGPAAHAAERHLRQEPQSDPEPVTA
jgi:MFS family permease